MPYLKTCLCRPNICQVVEAYTQHMLLCRRHRITLLRWLQKGHNCLDHGTALPTQESKRASIVISLSLSLSLYVNIYIQRERCIHTYVCVYSKHYTYMRVYVCMCRCMCISISLYIICIYIYRERERDPYIHLSIYPSINLSIYLHTCVCICIQFDAHIVTVSTIAARGPRLCNPCSGLRIISSMFISRPC